MDSRKAVVCLLLSFPIARALPAVSSVVITTYTLSTGIQTVQSVAIGQIASLLGVPSWRFKIAANSLASSRPNKHIREALDNACRMRGKVRELASLVTEMPSDAELRILLELAAHVQGDAYNWLAAKAGVNSSVCTEETMAEVCLQWEALQLSEKANSSLRDLRLTIDELHKKQITSVTIAEIIKGYFSS